MRKLQRLAKASGLSTWVNRHAIPPAGTILSFACANFEGFLFEIWLAKDLLRSDNGFVSQMYTLIFPPPGSPSEWPITIDRANHAYRFVFMDDCFSGETHDWANAFGIYGHPTYDDVDKNMAPAAAFLGFSGRTASWTDSDDDQAYQNTLNQFFTLWQQGTVSLAECVAACSYTNAYITRPIGQPQDYAATNSTYHTPYGSLVRYYGYPGTTRLGFK
jgi:hypothetical protein